MKKFTLIVISLFVFQSIAYTQENLDASVDCTNVQVDYSDDPTLTRGERIHNMDRSLSRSLNKFELCQSEKRKAESNDANGTPGGIGEQAGNLESGTSSESVASSTMSGTELPAAGDKIKEEPEISPVVQTTNNQNSKYEGNLPNTSGKIPDDIPSADNDSVLAAQIRRAAENETDPIKKEQLWNEYRKYKGLTQ